MKKIILSLVLLFVSLVCLVGCQPVEQSNGNLDAAKSYVFQLYKNSAEATSSSYTVVGAAVGNGEKFAITWSTNSEKVTVQKNEDGTVTIVVPEKSEEKIEYTLTATLTDGKNTVTQEFKHVVPKWEPTKYEDYLKLCKDEQNIVIIAYVIDVVDFSSSSGGSMYLQDKDGHGYYAYMPKTDYTYTGADAAAKNAEAAEQYPLGTEVEVTGTGTIYNGQYEFKSGCILKRTGNKVETLPYADATAAFAAAESNKDTSLIPYQNALAEIKGCIMQNIDGDYYYFTIGDGTVKFNLYTTYYFMSTADLNTLKAKWEAGKKFDIKGIVSCYSQAYQIYPIGVDAVDNISLPPLADDAAVAFVKGLLKLSTTEVGSDGDIAVDTKGYGDQVSIAWASDNAAVTYADGKLTVKMPDESVDVKITATLTAGEATDTVEFTLKLVVDAAFLSVEDAMEIVDGLEDNAWTEEKINVRGIVTSSSYSDKYGNYTIWLTDGKTEKAFELYAATFAGSVTGDYTATDALKGMYVTCKGYAQKYVKDGKATLEISGGNKEKGAAVISLVEMPVKAAMAAVNALEDNAWSEGPITVSGVVFSSSYSEKYGNYTIWLTDGETDQAFELYAATLKGSIKGDFTAANALKGYTVACTGYAQKYVKDGKATLEISGGNKEKGAAQVVFAVAPVMDVKAAMAAVNALEDNAWTPAAITVSGVVTSSSYSEKYGNYTIWLTDGETEKAFELYAASLGEYVTGDYTAADALKGYTVICSGYAQKYVKDGKATLEISGGNKEKGAAVIAKVIAPAAAE